MKLTNVPTKLPKKVYKKIIALHKKFELNSQKNRKLLDKFNDIFYDIIVNYANLHENEVDSKLLDIMRICNIGELKYFVE